VVKVIKSKGGVPTIKPLDPTMARKQGDEYRAARDAAQARLDAFPGKTIQDARNSGEIQRPFSSEEYKQVSLYRMNKWELGKLVAGRQHKNRLKKLQGFLTGMSSESH
jgi:hypothetical protein